MTVTQTTFPYKNKHICCSVLQCVAMCCSVLQCVAVCCNVLQCVAVCCSVMQFVAVWCNMLQYVQRTSDTYPTDTHHTNMLQ